MHIVRYEDTEGRVGFAVETTGTDGTVQHHRLAGDVLSSPVTTDERVRIKRRLAPVVPPAIYGIGLNYRRHAAEANMSAPDHPVVFMKAPTAVQHPDAPIYLPRHLASTKVDFECELAVVFGRRCKNVSRADALSYVGGYTCANDVSARDWQLKWGGSQWCRGKTFDTFCPLGPSLVTTDSIADPQQLGIRTRLNGETMQDWTTGDMIFDVATLIEFLSGSTTLEPGTVILTGTPHGVGSARNPPRYLTAGDVVEIEIDGIGTLINTVELEPALAGLP